MQQTLYRNTKRTNKTPHLTSMLVSENLEQILDEPHEFHVEKKSSESSSNIKFQHNGHTLTTNKFLKQMRLEKQTLPQIQTQTKTMENNQFAKNNYFKQRNQKNQVNKGNQIYQQKKILKKRLPLIWETEIPNILATAFENNQHKVIVLNAPTGYGKTVLTCYLLALHNKQSNSICTAIMPFRVSVGEMFNYLRFLFPQLNYGYAMRGNTKLSNKDNCQLMTVGYWLEQFLSNYREHGLPKDQMHVMIDEAHDSNWQTDLALQILLWIQTKNAQIQIIISSATLDVDFTVKNLKDNALIISTDDVNANVNVIFLDKPIQSIIARASGKLSMECIDQMVVILERIYDISGNIKLQSQGDCLVMLPGQDEIDKFMQIIEKKHQFNNFVFRPLHSQLSKEEIQEAINPDPEGKIKIIISTNIVENAITIKGLMYMIDSGLRKINKIDSDGINQLILEYASQSNLKQSYGRVGREGVNGTAYLMMTEDDFNSRNTYATNEVHNNPLYLQIIKLAHNKLPIEEILCHVDPKRIKNDVKFLIKHSALAYDDNENIYVTEYGKIMSQLQLSIKSSHFLSYLLINFKFDNDLFYIACVIAVWIDCGTSLFYKPQRKRGETMEFYNYRLEDLEELRTEFYHKDCVGTMLNVWLTSHTIPNDYKDGFYSWCRANGVFDKTLKTMNDDVYHLLRSLNEMQYIINIPDKQTLMSISEHIYDYIDALIPAMEIVFNDWIFLTKEYTNKYIPENVLILDKMLPIYIIDKNIKNPNSTQHTRVLSLGLRKIGDNCIILSNIIALPIQHSFEILHEEPKLSNEKPDNFSLSSVHLEIFLNSQIKSDLHEHY